MDSSLFFYIHHYNMDVMNTRQKDLFYYKLHVIIWYNIYKNVRYHVSHYLFI